MGLGSDCLFCGSLFGGFMKFCSDGIISGKFPFATPEVVADGCMNSPEFLHTLGSYFLLPFELDG